MANRYVPMTVENCVTLSPEQVAGERAGHQLVDEPAGGDQQDSGEEAGSHGRGGRRRPSGWPRR